MTCRHAQVTQSREHAFGGSVATPGHTDENRAAHGNITYTETCRRCGAEREINVNGNHIEHSRWWPAEDAERG